MHPVPLSADRMTSKALKLKLKKLVEGEIVEVCRPHDHQGIETDFNLNSAIALLNSTEVCRPPDQQGIEAA